MARWPGTALYFKSKVTYVRDDDNEYDVQFEDGTIYTLKAKEVKKMEAIPTAKKTPSRSRSRGRSPSRKSKASPARTPSEKKTSRSSAVFTAPKPDPTPTRQSARIAARKEAIPIPSHATGRSRRGGLFGFLKNLSFEWLGALFMMALSTLILISLHTLCTKTSCKP